MTIAQVLAKILAKSAKKLSLKIRIRESLAPKGIKLYRKSPLLCPVSPVFRQLYYGFSRLDY